MRLSDMVAKKTGLPSGFSGQRVKWNDVRERFQIVKAAVLSRPATNAQGEVLMYQQGPKEGKPIPDLQLALEIKTESGQQLLVRTNSKRLTSLYDGDIDREPDSINQYGDLIFEVEAPEGWLRFVPYNMEYANGQKGQVADLEEAED